jgi:hypothetical protein
MLENWPLPEPSVCDRFSIAAFRILGTGHRGLSGGIPEGVEV